MLKVILVDDEVWICQLIQHSIDWQSLGMEVVSVAHDGAEALEKIQLFQPDIVISDVRMPVLDGCGLARKLQELDNPPKLIMISGHQDFEYMRSAIRYAAVDYLLKPYNEEQLYEVLKKLSHEILSTRRKEMEAQKLRSKLSESIRKLRDLFINNLIFNQQLTLSNEQIEHDLQFNFTPGYFQIVLMKLDNPHHESVSQQITTYIQEDFSQDISDTNLNVYTYNHQKMIVTLLNFDAELAGQIYGKVSSSVKKLHADANIGKNILLTVGLGRQVASLEQLSDSWQDAFDSLNCRLLSGQSQIYDISKLDLNYVKSERIMTLDKENQFVRAIESFNAEELSSIIKNIFAPVLEREKLHPRTVYDLCRQIVQSFDQTVKKMGIPVNQIIESLDVMQLLTDNQKLTDIPATITRYLTHALEHYRKICQSRNSKPILLAQEYVRDHYQEQIHLPDVAKIVFLHPYYFSDLFKNEMGISFSDYLADYRISKAKELLKDMQYKVKDINELVGYSDSKAFSKIFKKIVGLSPQEYRKLYT